MIDVPVRLWRFNRPQLLSVSISGSTQLGNLLRPRLEEADHKSPRGACGTRSQARPRRGTASSFASGKRCTISSSICGRPKWCWMRFGYSEAGGPGGGAAGGLGAFALHLQQAVHGSTRLMPFEPGIRPKVTISGPGCDLGTRTRRPPKLVG